MCQGNLHYDRTDQLRYLANNANFESYMQYLHLVRQRDDMERQQIYFRGHTDAVGYLKKIKAI